ncbi:MAG: DUF5979 domain-containing protein, partial [Dehalococcoidia bacterium]|nr:DUF5979 domain-containing protein [Dehalococcoidia bacterium]
MCIALPAGNALANFSPPQWGTPNSAPVDAEYYVSALGDDAAGDGSQAHPWATLAKTADVINGSGQGKNYTVYVMTDLISTACARYFDNSVTIMSVGSTSLTVTRGTTFSTQSETRRGWYNPAMLEIGGDVSSTGPKISLTLKNIIFDDQYRSPEGTIFLYAPQSSHPSTDYAQDAIIASYSPNATIILDDGAELHNFGGMTAARANDGAMLVMKSGSLITDTNSTASTRQVSPVATDYRANGDAAVRISSNAHFFMYDGAKITNIANANSVSLSGTYKCFIDGEISYMKGNKGFRATDGNSSDTHEGRGFKSAVLFEGATLDPYTGASGSAIIGPNAYIHDNAIKCGAVAVNRSTSISVKIYGRINHNIGQTGTRHGVPIFGSMSVGANGGGLYIVAGGTVFLEEGSEVCNNSVINYAYGGGASVQQSGSKLIINGGIISGNTASGMGPGIAVNKNDAYFEINGGIVDNGANGILLFNNSFFTQTDTDCNSRLVLNAGTVSGVTVHSNVAYGNNTTNQYRNLYIGDDCTVTSGFASVAGKNVYPISTGFNIGNPNPDAYTSVRSALPQGWTMPTANSNVIGFWVKKDGRIEFAVSKPTTGNVPANYDSSLNIYYAAVQGNLASGAVDTSSQVKIYPTTINGGRIVVSIPLESAYPNGATVVLVQPTKEYGKIEFNGTPNPLYCNDINTLSYHIGYTASYDMPLGLRTNLITDGHTNANTITTLTIYPDSRTVPDVSSLTIASEVFEIADASWEPSINAIVVTLHFKSGWDTATSLLSTFSFDCDLDASYFGDGEFLSLTGTLTIASASLSRNYLVYGDEAKIEMIMLKGDIHISKILSGDATDATKDFHFIVMFSDNGIYNGVASGDTIVLKGGETYVIVGIPYGVTYTVVEVEANKDGYITTSTGANGAISKALSEAVFTNSKSHPNQYTINYNANGGSGLMPYDTAFYGYNVSLS